MPVVALFDGLTGKKSGVQLLVPLLFVQGLDLLIFVVEIWLVFDLDLYCVVVVDCLGVFLAASQTDLASSTSSPAEPNFDAFP